MPSLDIKIRHEGPMINAYFPTSTKGDGDPVLVASLRTAVADMHPEQFDAFVAFVSQLARALVEGVGLKIESINTSKAPEHEGAGHA